MTNTAVYTRISMDKTGEALGSQRQYDACLELANRLGWNVTHHFDDPDISAYNGKRRPGFEALLDAMTDGAIDSFLVWHVDRLYRSFKDLGRLVDIARAHNIQIRTVTSGDIDLSTAAGRQMASILCAVGVGEMEHKSERHKLANEQARAAGKWRSGGAAVFGYDAKGAIVEHEGVLIRSAAADVLAGRSLRSLAREWNDAGILTRRGGAWSANGFRHMIGNPRYAALMTHNKKVVGKGDWEPILDQETHLAVAAIISDPKRRSQQSTERRYVGSGVYVCGICGGRLQSVSSKPKGGKRTHQYGCRTNFHLTCAVEPLDAYVENEVLGMLLVNDVSGAIGDDTENVTELARRRDGLQARLDELGRMFATGDIDASQLRSGSAELHQQMAGINSILAALLRTSPTANLLNGDGDLRAKWKATSPEMRGRIVDELVTVTVQRVGQARGRWGKIEDRVDITPKPK